MTVLLAQVAGMADPPQSVLHPASPEARELEILWWVMFWACAITFVAVVVFALRALSSGRRSRPPGGTRWFVLGGGVVLPVIVLTGFLLYSLRVAVMFGRPAEGETIEVIGRQFWWEVRYPDHGIITANELHLPAGERVRLVLEAADVIHSLWIPNLHGKRDMIPGVRNEMWIRASNPGVWRGQCAEFCGMQHAKMALVVVAMEREEFAAWIADRQRAAAVAGENAAAGREVFLANGCASCHRIDGLPDALSNIGPDLTHIGSRLSLGAATLPNTPDTLAQWIVDPHTSKPGNLMPPTEIAPADLGALVDYLRTLE